MSAQKAVFHALDISSHVVTSSSMA